MELLRKYDSFILSNASQVSAIESALRSLTYLLPGRFQDSELASEFIYTTINLLGLRHDQLLYQAALTSSPNYKPTTLNRYLRHVHSKSSLSKNVSLLLTLIQTVEVLVEMTVKRRKGDKQRWKIVMWIEGIKVLCRLILLQQNQSKLVLSPSYPIRDVDPALINPTSSSSYSPHFQPDSSLSQSHKRTNRIHPPLSVLAAFPSPGVSSSPFGDSSSGSDPVVEYLNSRALLSCVKSPDDLVHPLKGSRLVGEYMFILRPLIYVYLLRKHGSRSYTPWMISLSLEILSRVLSLGHTTSSLIPAQLDRSIHSLFSKFFGAFSSNKLKGKGASEKGYVESEQPEKLTLLEKDEYKRRLFLLLFYLLRNPVYEKLTKPRLDSFCASMIDKPLIRIFAAILQDYQPLWENIYFYTCGS
ncbi:peroxisome membrane protein [Paraphysoderma sedebokerense]|nr:peroxisome membrane protein [Paraphysoderma sedebokerense]